MDKLKMHSPNLTQDHIARLRELFPGCVTEAQGEGGQFASGAGGSPVAAEFGQIAGRAAQVKKEIDSLVHVVTVLAR